MERIHEAKGRTTLAIFDFCSSFSIYFILLWLFIGFSVSSCTWWQYSLFIFFPNSQRNDHRSKNIPGLISWYKTLLFCVYWKWVFGGEIPVEGHLTNKGILTSETRDVLNRSLLWKNNLFMYVHMILAILIMDSFSGIDIRPLNTGYYENIFMFQLHSYD